MKTSFFSTKDVALMGLLVGVVFTVCLYVCSLYVNKNHTTLVQDLGQDNIVQVIE